jgi:uncharacterized membrane protein YuzA (DUF378 family)
MLQYIVVFAIVGIAMVYTISKLTKQAKGRGCDNCECSCNAGPKNLEETADASGK